MRTDRFASVAAALLGLLGLAATGWIALPLLPATPHEALALAVPLLALLLLVAAAGGQGRQTPRVRMASLALGAVPFLAFAVGSASGGSVGLVLPGLGLVLVLALCLALADAPASWRRLGAAAVLALLAGDAVLTTAELPLLPAEANPLRAPVRHHGAAAREDRARGAERRGERPGCFVRGAGDLAPRPGGSTPADEAWGVATSGPLPRDGRVIRLLSPDAGHAPPGSLRPGGRFDLTVASQGPELRHPFDLSAYDALLAGPLAWEDDGAAEARARAVSGWVRGGGVLFVAGDGPRLWPAQLERVLGATARQAVEGAGRPLRLGAGHVVCAPDGPALGQLLTSFTDLLEARPLGTLFDGLAVPPSPPLAFRAPPDDGPGGRRGQGALLLAFAAAAWLIEPAVRAGRSALALLAFPALAGALAVLAAAPRTDAVALHAAVIELGGPGGRRVEVLHLEAGARGYVGQVAFRGGGATRWIGPPLGEGGAVVLRPGESGWAVRHGEARGDEAGEREDRGAAWLIGWLVGPVDPGRLVLTRGGFPDAIVPGAAAAEAAVLRVRPEAP